MNVDITALSGVVRRFDESSTLKSFAAVLSFLFVLMNLGAIFSFGASMAWVGGSFDEEEVRSAAPYALGALAVMIGVSFTPLAFIAVDWVSRKPWRHLAAIAGGLIGALGMALVGALIGLGLRNLPEITEDIEAASPAVLTAIVPAVLLGLLLVWLLAPSARVRKLALGSLLLLPALAALGFVIGTVADADEPALTTAQLTLALLAGAFVIWLFVRAVLLRVVLSGDRPRALLLGDFQDKGFWTRFAFLSGLPSSLWRASALVRPSLWAFTLARPLVYVGALLLAGRVAIGLHWLTQLAIGALLLIGGHFAFAGAKRLESRATWNPAQLQQERAPILFLRSFTDDQIEFRQPRWRLLRRWLQLWSFRRNADEALIDEAAQYGPVVALGRPKEAAPPYGARRLYPSDDDWQKIIVDTACASRAIVIGAGSTPGVIWEYQMLARERLLDRTLLLFPPRQAGRAENLAALEEFVKATSAGRELRPPEDRSLVAVLPTASGPVLVTAESASGAACTTVMRAFFQGVRPEQLGDPLSELSR